jgi:hypothetical protein
VLTIP